MNCIIRTSKDRLVKCLRNVTAHRAITTREFAFKCGNYDIAIFEIGDTEPIRDIGASGDNVYVVINQDIQLSGAHVVKPEDLARVIYKDKGIIICDGEIEDETPEPEEITENIEVETEAKTEDKTDEKAEDIETEAKTEDKTDEKAEDIETEAKTEDKTDEKGAVNDVEASEIEEEVEDADTEIKDNETEAKAEDIGVETEAKAKDIEVEAEVKIETAEESNETNTEHTESKGSLSDDTDELLDILENESKDDNDADKVNTESLEDIKEEYTKKLEDIKRKNTEYKEKIDIVTRENAGYIEKVAEMEAKLQRKEAEYNNLMSNCSKLSEEIKQKASDAETEQERLNNIINGLNEKLSAAETGGVSQEEFDRIQREKEVALEQVEIARSERENQIKEIEEELNSLKEDKKRMGEVISDFENVKIDIENKCNEQKAEELAIKQREIDAKVERIDELISECSAYMEMIKVSVTRFNEVTEYNKAVELKLKETESRLNDANNSVLKASNQISELSNKYDESLREKLDDIKELSENVESLKNDLENKENERVKLQEEYERLVEENKELSEKAKALDDSTAQMTISALRNENEGLRRANKRLKDNYNNLSNAMLADDVKAKAEDVQPTQSAGLRRITFKDMNDNEDEEAKAEYITSMTITRLNEKIRELSKENSELKKIIDCSIGKETINKPKSLIRSYLGEAKIIAIQSTNSCGATTLGMSIITELAKRGDKAVYLDLDIVSPDADGWFETDPVCQVDIDGGFESRTALGAIYKLGVSFFRLNKDKLTKTVSRNIDYIGGLYTSVSGKDLISVKYDELFNFIGNMYDYIIVDLGRIGGSVEMESIAKSIIDISKMYFLVSTNDSVAIRNAVFKLEDCGVNDKVNWIIRSPGKSIVRNAQKFIGDNAFTLVPEIDTMTKGRRKYQDVKSRELSAVLQNIMQII